MQIDKEGANIERVKQELSENGLLPEEWGGQTAMVPVRCQIWLFFGIIPATAAGHCPVPPPCNPSMIGCEGKVLVMELGFKKDRHAPMTSPAETPACFACMLNMHKCSRAIVRWCCMFPP